MKRVQIKYVELAILMALAITLLWGAWSLQSQDQLAEGMIRLHVIANSDDPADQQLKLKVRDAVLKETETVLAQTESRTEAITLVQEALLQLEETATRTIREAGYDYAVSARLEQTEFPRKDYDYFALPSGEYLALRLVIGEGAGENWWCVVYPPLCMTAATDLEETAVICGMEQGQVDLMQEKDAGYVIKFRSLELWEQLRQWLKKK